MRFHERFELFGKLEVEEVLDFFDKPLMLIVKNQVDNRFFIKLGNETEEEEVWVYIPVSRRRIEAIKTGAISIQNAFLHTENQSAFIIHLPFLETAEVVSETITSSEIPLSYLPPSDAKFSLPVRTLPILENIKIVANQLNRVVFRMHLYFENSLRTEAPINELGGIFISTQNMINSIGQALKENYAKSGRVPFSIVGENELMLRGVGANSFEIELVSAKIPNVLGETEIDLAIQKFIELIGIGDDSNRLNTQLKALQPRVASNYYKFLDSITGSIESTKYDWASPNGIDHGSISITTEKARNAMVIIELANNPSPEIISVTGELIGIHLKTRRFWLETETGTVAGYMTKDRIDSFIGVKVGENYNAKIQRQKVNSLKTDVDEYKYELLSLEQIAI